MKPKLFTAILVLATSSAAFGQTPAFSFCGTYGAYVMLYKNTDQFEELGKLRCGEKVEVLSKWFDYLQIRTLDGKVGWVRSADVTGGPSSTPSATPFGLTNSLVQRQHEVIVPLNNKNILAMQAMRLSPEVMIAKIKSSPASFDTSAAALEKLKYAGVPDKVIVAMVQAPAVSVAAVVPDAAPKAPDVVQVKIPDGTPVDLEMIASVSSDAVREGTIIHLKVAKDVVVEGVDIFKKGSEARARVYVITQPAFMGKPGEISWAMEDITAVTGDQLPATFAPQEAGSARPSGSSVEDTGTAWEFRKNKPTTMPAGHRLRATIHGDIVLKIPAALAAQPHTDSDAAATSSQNIQPLPESSSLVPRRSNPR
jgi:uncharacterized protein YgiM (DUF1202 family)